MKNLDIYIENIFEKNNDLGIESFILFLQGLDFLCPSLQENGLFSVLNENKVSENVLQQIKVRPSLENYETEIKKKAKFEIPLQFFSEEAFRDRLEAINTATEGKLKFEINQNNQMMVINVMSKELNPKVLLYFEHDHDDDRPHTTPQIGCMYVGQYIFSFISKLKKLYFSTGSFSSSSSLASRPVSSSSSSSSSSSKSFPQMWWNFAVQDPFSIPTTNTTATATATTKSMIRGGVRFKPKTTITIPNPNEEKQEQKEKQEEEGKEDHDKYLNKNLNIQTHDEYISELKKKGYLCTSLEGHAGKSSDIYKCSKGYPFSSMPLVVVKFSKMFNFEESRGFSMEQKINAVIKQCKKVKKFHEFEFSKEYGVAIPELHDCRPILYKNTFPKDAIRQHPKNSKDSDDTTVPEEIRMATTIEFIDGMKLLEYLQEEGGDKVPGGKKKEVVQNIREALGEMSEKGYIHNDTHLGNFLVVVRDQNSRLFSSPTSSAPPTTVVYLMDTDYVEVPRFLQKEEDEKEEEKNLPKIINPTNEYDTDWSLGSGTMTDQWKFNYSIRKAGFEKFLGENFSKKRKRHVDSTLQDSSSLLLPLHHHEEMKVNGDETHFEKSRSRIEKQYISVLNGRQQSETGEGKTIHSIFRDSIALNRIYSGLLLPSGGGGVAPATTGNDENNNNPWALENALHRCLRRPGLDYDSEQLGSLGKMIDNLWGEEEEKKQTFCRIYLAYQKEEESSDMAQSIHLLLCMKLALVFMKEHVGGSFIAIEGGAKQKKASNAPLIAAATGVLLGAIGMKAFDQLANIRKKRFERGEELRAAAVVYHYMSYSEYKLKNGGINLKKIYGDIEDWDVSGIDNMDRLFYRMDNFNADISRWDVSNVTSMNMTFFGCTSFNQNLSKWNVSNVTNMNYTFAKCKSLNQDLSAWDVRNVKTAFWTFYYCVNYEYSKMPKFIQFSEEVLKQKMYTFHGCCQQSKNETNQDDSSETTI